MTLIFAGGGFSFGSLGFFEEFLFRGYLQFTHIRCSATRARRSRLQQTVFKMEQFSGWCYSILFRNENEELTPKQLSAVPCPTCGVAAGQRCVLLSGAPRNEPHVDRKIAATEAVEKERFKSAAD